MKTIKFHKLFFVAILLMATRTSFAQQQVMFTQYMFNQLALNPAYAGIHEGISTSFLARHQWVGFEGAPRTQTFSIHSPLKYRAIGLGAVLVRDQIGITDQFGGHFSYSYRIRVTKGSQLSFGLQASFNQYSADFTSNPNNDPNLAGQNINDLSLNFGAGVMWHSDKFYLGFSLPQVLNSNLGDGFSTVDPITGDPIEDQAQLIRHYFLTAGYVFPINRNLKFKPNVMMKWVQGAPLQFDLNANFLISEILWLGVSYRSLDSFDALVQIQISPQFQIGYAYDFYTTTELNQVNSGSHEIMINYIFNIKGDKIVTPRYF